METLLEDGIDGQPPATPEKRFPIGLIFVSFFIIANFSVYAATYYVASNGNNSNPGTIDLPWLTIQNAANILIAGDTVNVRAGTYNEAVTPVNSGTVGNDITYQACIGETVILDGQNTRPNAFAIGGKNYIIINGFQMIDNTQRGVLIETGNYIIVKNNTIADFALMGIESKIASSYIEIDHNTISTSNANAQTGVWMTQTSNANIHNNTVHDLPMNGISIADHSSNGQIYNNLIYNTGSHTPQFWAGIAMEDFCNNNVVYNNVIHNARHAGLLTNSSGNYFYNNTVYASADGAGWGAAIFFVNWNGSTCGGNLVKNNLFIPTGSTEYTVIVQSTEGTTNTFDNNIHFHPGSVPSSEILWGPGVYKSFSSWKTTCGQEVHGSFINPLFINTGTYDFHLQRTSPAINAGADLGSVFATDYAGTPRPQGSAFDIGAYEYIPLTVTINQKSDQVDPTHHPQPVLGR